MLRKFQWWRFHKLLSIKSPSCTYLQNRALIYKTEHSWHSELFTHQIRFLVNYPFHSCWYYLLPPAAFSPSSEGIGVWPWMAKKGHAATLWPLSPPGWGEEREEKDKTRALGWGQFNRTAKEANNSNNNTDKNILKQQNTQSNSLSLPDAQCPPETQLTSPHPAPPPRTEHGSTWYRFVWPVWVSQLSCVPS